VQNQHFAKELRRPVVSHIETQNLASPMLDHKKAVEQLECHRQHRKKSHATSKCDPQDEKASR
jgi:hypothetical protein